MKSNEIKDEVEKEKKQVSKIPKLFGLKKTAESFTAGSSSKIGIPRESFLSSALKLG